MIIPGRTLVDIGCANGYFGFRFIQDGGASVRGVDTDRERVDFVNELAQQKKINFNCDTYVAGYANFDYGIFLDTIYHDRVSEQYLDYLKENCKTVFVSPSGQGGVYNERLKQDLLKRFSYAMPIYQGFESRVIYKCG